MTVSERVVEKAVEVRVDRVTKYFGGLVAVDNVSMDIEPRKVTLIIGPNGSGKTTLLNIISGYYKPDKGRVFYRGADITGLPPHKINSLGLARTFQIPKPFQNLTVLENMLVAARFNPGERMTASLFKARWIKTEEALVEKAFIILRELNLDKVWDQRASSLSGGQMKLLEIGRVLMNDASTILMDEPVAGVLPSLAIDIFKMIRELVEKRNLTFIIIEHRLDVALGFVDYVYAMARGRVISQGTPEKVINDPLVQESYLQG